MKVFIIDFFNFLTFRYLFPKTITSYIKSKNLTFQFFFVGSVMALFFAIAMKTRTTLLKPSPKFPLKLDDVKSKTKQIVKQ